LSRKGEEPPDFELEDLGDFKLDLGLGDFLENRARGA
jgi:hypothetical protein